MKSNGNHKKRHLVKDGPTPAEKKMRTDALGRASLFVVAEAVLLDPHPVEYREEQVAHRNVALVADVASSVPTWRLVAPARTCDSSKSSQIQVRSGQCSPHRPCRPPDSM